MPLHLLSHLQMFQEELLQYTIYDSDNVAYRMLMDRFGRENMLKEFIKDKAYVSRSHAKVVSDGEKLYIFNLSGTNFTYVGNKKISNDEPTLLKVGDEIGLGGFNNNGNRQELAAYFIVGEK